MNGYLSLREMAEKWGVSERRINQYCTQGRIPGAQKFGKSWAIPEDAHKPEDPRRARNQVPARPEPQPEELIASPGADAPDEYPFHARPVSGCR